jgi:transcriptional regulator with XRE-family HTH domain
MAAALPHGRGYAGPSMTAHGPAAALGEAIRRNREANAISMRQFAERAGISNPYLSQIERGLREPSQRVVDAIARSLEVSVDALYADAGIAPTAAPAPSDVRHALQSDPALTSRQRRALLEVYDGFVALNEQRHDRAD